MPTVLVPGIPISLRMLLAGLITTPIPLSLSAATVGRSALATIPLASLSVSKACEVLRRLKLNLAIESQNTTGLLCGKG